VALGSRALRALAATWRVREVGREGWEARRAAGLPTMIALWHGQMLPLLPHHRGQGVAVLVSEHRDGEIITRVLRAFGFETVRGSTSRGGARALLEMSRVLRAGREVAVTPDGPRGPRHAFAPGALVAAQRAGAAVVGVAAHVDRAWRLKETGTRSRCPPARSPASRSRTRQARGGPGPDGARCRRTPAPAFEAELRGLPARLAAGAGQAGPADPRGLRPPWTPRGSAERVWYGAGAGAAAARGGARPAGAAVPRRRRGARRGSTARRCCARTRCPRRR
jgi:lysophospholipid acyltransferase (LPLAT)-like uncharacterized protein